MLCHDSGSAAYAPICNIRAPETDAQAKLSAKVDAVTGKAIFQAHCALCHVVRMREKDDGDTGKPEKATSPYSRTVRAQVRQASDQRSPLRARRELLDSGFGCALAHLPEQLVHLQHPRGDAIVVRAVLHRLPVRKWQAQTKTCRLHLAIPSKNARAEVSSALIPLKACGRSESEQLPRNSLRDESRHLIHCPLEIDSTLSTHGIPQRSGRLATAPHGR
jgi:hypothetical protein